MAHRVLCHKDAEGNDLTRPPLASIANTTGALDWDSAAAWMGKMLEAPDSPQVGWLFSQSNDARAIQDLLARESKMAAKFIALFAPFQVVFLTRDAPNRGGGTYKLFQHTDAKLADPLQSSMEWQRTDTMPVWQLLGREDAKESLLDTVASQGILFCPFVSYFFFS